ncbi:uncharacterized protein LOC126309711 isoform X2 [Schistocerca gregaria]|uniref:uncharacterized protein LOC126309711 isoform X2 n=1 Tax=Schistocerca gregaria TaxID=7010 RepID=UPI00211E7858|nr:uncharacterized protein LOC126309711 isoform X2 [Schistocerca gregaria]
MPWTSITTRGLSSCHAVSRECARTPCLRTCEGATVERLVLAANSNILYQKRDYIAWLQCLLYHRMGFWCKGTTTSSILNMGDTGKVFFFGQAAASDSARDSA